jgi:hypothetical protein
MDENKKQNFKIIIIIFIIFLIVLSSLILLRSFETRGASFDINKKSTFFSSNFSSNSIFILGSSQIAPVDPISVNQILNDKIIEEYEVYNLAYGGNAPYRDQFGNELVKIQPKLLVYGISYRDFEFSQENTFDDSFLPDAHKIIEYQLLKLGNDKFPLNPQFLIRTLIRDFSSEDAKVNSITSVYHENTPFYPYNTNPILKSYDEVISKNTTSAKLPRLLEDTSHPFKRHSEKFLELFLEKMNDNSINVVLISTPLADISSIDPKIKNNYEIFLKKLEKKYGITIFRFDTAYYGLDLWENKSHVSYHPDVTKYNEDIAKIILNEVK